MGIEPMTFSLGSRAIPLPSHTKTFKAPRRGTGLSLGALGVWNWCVRQSTMMVSNSASVSRKWLRSVRRRKRAMMRSSRGVRKIR